MNELITKEEIEAVISKASTLNLEDILNKSMPLTMVNSRIDLESGYVVILTYDSYLNVNVEHLSISNLGDSDAASFDHIACAILGSDCVYIGAFLRNIWHYLKFVSGDKDVFNGFVEYMKSGTIKH